MEIRRPVYWTCHKWRQHRDQNGTYAHTCLQCSDYLLFVSNGTNCLETLKTRVAWDWSFNIQLYVCNRIPTTGCNSSGTHHATHSNIYHFKIDYRHQLFVHICIKKHAIITISTRKITPRASCICLPTFIRSGHVRKLRLIFDNYRVRY